MKILFTSTMLVAMISACSNSNFRSNGNDAGAAKLQDSNSDEAVAVSPSSKNPAAPVKKTETPDPAAVEDFPSSTSSDSTLGVIVTAIPADIPPSQIVPGATKAPVVVVTAVGGDLPKDDSKTEAKVEATATPTPIPPVAKTCGGSSEGTIVADATAFSISKAPRNDLCVNHPAQKKCVDGAWQPYGVSYPACSNAEVMSPRSLAIENEGPNRGTCVTDSFQDLDGFSGSYRLYCTTGHTNGVTNNAVSKVTFSWDQSLLPLSDRLLDFNIETFDGTGNFIFNVNDREVRTCPSHSCGGSSLMSVVNRSSANKFYFNVLSPCYQQGGCNTYGNMYMRVKYKYHSN